MVDPPHAEEADNNSNGDNGVLIITILILMTIHMINTNTYNQHRYVEK